VTQEVECLLSKSKALNSNPGLPKKKKKKEKESFRTQTSMCFSHNIFQSLSLCHLSNGTSPTGSITNESPVFWVLCRDRNTSESLLYSLLKLWDSFSPVTGFQCIAISYLVPFLVRYQIVNGLRKYSLYSCVSKGIYYSFCFSHYPGPAKD
jgi:hypothetical protein